MSWEEMYSRDYPCSCGKGTYTEVVEMDDWNRRREHRTINCPECAESEKIAKINEAKEGERLRELDEEIKTYFALPSEMKLFSLGFIDSLNKFTPPQQVASEATKKKYCLYIIIIELQLK